MLKIHSSSIRHGARIWHADVQGACEIENVECGGAFSFWPRKSEGDHRYRGLTDSPPDEEWGTRPPDVRSLSVSFSKGLQMRGVRIAADLSLVNVEAGGDISIRDCVIGQDLDLGSHDSTDGKRTRTHCNGLNLEGTVCEGDANLTGLDAEYDANGRRLRVSGDLSFATRPQEGATADGPSAFVRGRLDLSAAEASHMIISGTGFTSEKKKISFERGRFRRFQVLSPFPANLDMSDIVVERYEVAKPHLRDLLRRTDPFTISTYLGVERVLRNEADDNLANRVYRDMKWRNLRAEHSLSRRLFPARLLPRFVGELFGRFMGFGTANGRLLWIFTLPLLVCSIFVFSSPRNIVPTTAAMEGNSTLREWTNPAAWGFSEAFWMSLRFQVPVIPILARSRWEPGRDGMWLGDVQLTFVSPEGYAYVMLILHAIIWPAFLLGMASKVIRSRQSG
jgi:hypothetical protein